MNIVPMDPRIGGPTFTPAKYRVCFWEQGGRDPNGLRSGYGSDEYEITDARDVFEIIAWAHANSGPGKGRIYPGSDRTFTLYVLSGPSTPSRVLIAGTDPTWAKPDPADLTE